MDLEFLRPLYEQIDGCVSVYLDTHRAEENAAKEIELRWRAAREQLAGEGADEATLDAAAAVINDPAEAAPGRAVFARNGAVVLTGALHAPPRREIARFAPLPHVMPMLAQLYPLVPHLLVSATREGGEVIAVGGTGEQWRDFVAGRSWPVHKTPSGGWAQDIHQRHVEEVWNENAKALAADAATEADRVGAKVIIVAGDVRARTLLLDHLPKALREAAAEVGEEVSADSEAMSRAARRLLQEWADGDTAERFDDWRARRAHGLGNEGLGPVMAALRDSQVSDLFLADNPSSAAMAWIGTAGPELAATREELLERNVPEPARDRADAALARAAAITGAELRFLPSPPADVSDDPLDSPDEGPPSRVAATGDIDPPADGVCATFRFSLESS